MNIEKVERISGFKDLLILGSEGEIKYQHTTRNNPASPTVLAGHLASAFAIAENTTFTFVGNLTELAFDGDDGSVLIMHNNDHYFFLILKDTPSMGIARLKLRELADEYAL